MERTPNQNLEYNQCQDAVRRLNEFLSRELQPEEEEMVQRHLRECRGCFDKFRFEETLLRTIREKAEQMRAPETLRSKLRGLFGTMGEGG
jgi:anti-sigma factor (TIGR02949 family)